MNSTFILHPTVCFVTSNPKKSNHCNPEIDTNRKMVKISRRLTTIQSFQKFQQRPGNAELENCCSIAAIKSFKPNEIILKDDKNVRNYAYFVLSGHCAIVQYLKIKVNKRGQGLFYTFDKFEDLNTTEIKKRDSSTTEIINKIQKREILPQPEKNEDTSSSNHQLEDNENDEKFLHKFFNIGHFSAGSIFGMGEQMEQRLIVAKNVVQCLLIPRYWLFQKEQNIGNIWNITRIYLECTIPSREKVFQIFLSNKKWKKYKNNLVAVLMRNSRNCGNRTRLVDVPEICRIENGFPKKKNS